MSSHVATLRRRVARLSGRVRAGAPPMFYVVSIPFGQPEEVYEAWLAAHGPRPRPCDLLVFVWGYADPPGDPPRLVRAEPLGEESPE